MATTLLNDFDFFLLGGDDLFVIVENLRRVLDSPEIKQLGGSDGSVPLYLGRKIQANKYLSFHSGGSGYVLNGAAVARLYRAMDLPACLPTISASMEDLLVGQCLLQV